VSDLHIRILRLVARQRQHNLDAYDAVEHEDTEAKGRRQGLERIARRTRARVTDAQSRRRYQRPGRAV
jgi:hypothetical protein